MKDALQGIPDGLEAVPSGTVTFLFTDIEGSTKLLERLREGYATVLAEQRDLLRESFSRWNGHEIDTQGDAFFVAFPRAVDAVCCVIEAQQALSAHTWPEGASVRVRMGLHTGEPMVGRTGYVGMDVHRAARIAAAGHGGQVLLSQTTRELVYQDLPSGASLVDLGSHKLKDIRFPQQIFQLKIQGLPCDFPPLKTLTTEEEPPTPGEAPFKGLQYFEEADAPLFFGRSQITARLVEAVSKERFLAVIGASGSGKSSVVRAGLIPALKKSQPGAWQVVLLTPTAHPLEALALALTQGSGYLRFTAALMDDLRIESRILHLFARKTRPRQRFLLVVDQFEELFTLCRETEERQSFIANLLYASTAPEGSVHILLTLRADFYEHLAEYAELREAIARHQEYLGSMSSEELRQAIEEPAKLGGWEFSPGLVELMLHEVGAEGGRQPEPGALPLLSHALLETWKHRRGNLMNLRAYVESGGVRKAIARTAESLYTQELTPAQKAIARNIFLRLTELGEGTQDTRRRATLQELFPPAPYADPKDVEEVLVKLADARLIITGEGTAEVAHEALIREWPTLREWLAQDREGLRLQRHLSEAAQDWQMLEQDPGIHYRGARLAQALEWVQANPHQPNEQELAFLKASQAAAEREEAEKETARQRELEAAQKLAETERGRAEEQAQASKRLRQRAVILSIALVLAAIFAGAAVIFGGQAQQKTQIATSRELAAAAVSNLQVDPELSILLAIQAITKNDTLEAQNALHQALLASHLVSAIQADSRAVYGVAISPDSKRLASAGMDGVIKIWDLEDLSALPGKEPSSTRSNPVDYNVSLESAGHALAFSPDGSRLAAVAEKQSVKIWDAASGQLLLTLSGHQGNVYALDFSPDGKRLATASEDRTAKVWDASTGQELLALPANEYEIFLARFTPDGKYLITCVDDASARFWDLEAEPVKELFMLTFDYVNEGPPDTIDFSPDGKYMAISSGQVARAWDYEGLLKDPAAKPLFALYGHENNINKLVYTPDGARLVTGSADGTARVWDAFTGQELILLPGRSAITSLAMSPDGIHPITGHGDGRVKIWDISPTASREAWAIYQVWRGHLSQDRKRLATIFIPDMVGNVKFQTWEFSPQTVKEINSVQVDHGARISAYAINPDQPFFITVGADMTAKVWDVGTGQLRLSIPIGVDATSNGHTDFVFGADINPEGTRLATAGDDGKIILWDLSSGKVLLSLVGHEGPSRSVVFSPDGNRMATGSFDRTARIWDAASGELLQTLTGQIDMVYFVSFSPDGKRLLNGSNDGTARLWDIETGKELLTLKGHSGSVFGLDFSPDGSQVAAGSTDGTVIVWDASTGKALLSLPGMHAHFGPEGKSLVTISVDGIGRGFILDKTELLALARQRVPRSLTQEECQKYLYTTTCP